MKVLASSLLAPVPRFHKCHLLVLFPCIKAITFVSNLQFTFSLMYTWRVWVEYGTDYTNLLTCRCNSFWVHCGAFMEAKSSRCSHTVRLSNRTSRWGHTPNSVLMEDKSVCRLLPLMMMLPEEGGYSPVSIDLPWKNISHQAELKLEMPATETQMDSSLSGISSRANTLYWSDLYTTQQKTEIV